MGFPSPFRRSHNDAKSVIQWVSVIDVPSVALLAHSGVIIEANPAFRALFPSHPLLEMDVEGLFPAQHKEVRAALREVERVGAATLNVTIGDKGFAFVLGTRAQQGMAIAGVLHPQPPPPPPRDPQRDPRILFAPLQLDPRWGQLSFELQLRSLFRAVTEQWPVQGVALLQRGGMALEARASHGLRADWADLHLSAVELGYLLHDGKPVHTRLGEHAVMLYPLYLVSEEQPWGAIGLLHPAHSPYQEVIEHATARIATLMGLIVTYSQERSHLLTQRRERAQERMVRNHLLSSMRRGALLINPSGQIEFINEAASNLLNWPVTDVLGRPLLSLLPDLGPLGSKIIQTLEADAPRQGETATGRLQRPGKRGVEMNFTIEKVSGSSGYLIIFLEDQENVLAFGETQHHLDRLAVLGKMSAMIAHDLRNPLASILYGIETLAESLGEDHPEVESINLLLAEGERVHRIIEDVLSISRQPSLTINLCSLRTLMDQVVDTHQRQLQKKQIQLRRYYDPSLPMVEGDSVRLGQMLGNLLSNAIDALSEAGQIEVVLRPLTIEQIIVRGLNPEQEERLQGGVEILIRDNGPGIPESQREQVFEPLFTTKSSGTGLGLPIVRTIVEQHRGLIVLDSELGKGTTFQIFLPQLGVSYRNQE